jgi:rare lipoprotein A
MTAEQNTFGGGRWIGSSGERIWSRERRRAVSAAGLVLALSLGACQSITAGLASGNWSWINGGTTSQVAARPDGAIVVSGVRFHPSTDPDDIETGTASWYGPGFEGRRTASGERFDEDALTAAHPSFDMPSLVRVTNLETGRTLILRINDRGPVARGRVIDISERGAELLGFKGDGTTRVKVELLEPDVTLAELPVGPGSRADADQVAELPPEELIPDTIPVILGQEDTTP